MISVGGWTLIKDGEYEQLLKERSELAALKKALELAKNYCSPIGAQHGSGWNDALYEINKHMSGYGEWIK